MKRWTAVHLALVVAAASLGVAAPAHASGEWEQRGADLLGSGGSEFGHSTALSADGNTLVAGSPLADPGSTTNAGTARVFDWNGDSWEQRGLTIEGANANDYLGQAVAISADGNTIAIGAPSQMDTRDTPGYVQVHSWDDGSQQWSQIGVDIVGENNDDEFGSSVALSADGSILAVGAPYNDGNGTRSGHVRIFERDGTTWNQLGSDINGGTAGDEFGTSVALSANGVIMAGGAPFNDTPGTDSGNARVFIYDSLGDSWSKIAQSISGEASGDRSGSSVALSADGFILAIGAPFSDGNGADSGQVRVYAYDAATDLWTQRGTDIDGEVSGDLFGRSVALSNDAGTLVGGARNSDDGGFQSGQVRAFVWDATQWNQRGQDMYPTQENGAFGFSVDISADGDVIVGGDPYSDIAAFNAGLVRAYTWSGASSAGIPGPATYFTFLLPDGRECTSISPQRVQVGTFVNLPGEDALCKTMDGSLVAGWMIPVPPGFTGAGSSSLPLNPGHRVRVIESQRFTLVPFEPIMQIDYDANVAKDDTCTPADIAHSSDDGRLGHVWVPRDDFTMARTPTQAPCTPGGYELIGWNTAGDGTGETIEPGAGLPDDWHEGGTNHHRLYAMWRASS